MKPEIKLPMERIVVNTGVGRLRQRPDFEPKVLPYIMDTLAAITGQRPEKTAAKRSIAEFRMREGDVVGLKVTLRGRRATDFLSRFVNAGLPRVRDFRGLSESAIDEHGNLNIGVHDQSVFPEVNMDDSVTEFGMQITIVGAYQNKTRMTEAYRAYGVPLTGLRAKGEQ